MALSIEEKYDEVRQLITMGKEKGYLLYEEVNEMLPSEITSSDELDDIFSMFGQMGIEVVDSEQKFREAKEGEEGAELDLTPGTLDKTNDPVRMYLREMGTVPLLTREGEVEIAKRIERGKKAVMRIITRTPMAAQEVARLAERLGAGELTVRDVVIFNEEEVTEEKIANKIKETLKLTTKVAEAHAEYLKYREKFLEIGKREPKYIKAKWKLARLRVRMSLSIQRIEFAEPVKRRLVERLRESVERIREAERTIDKIEVKIKASKSEENRQVLRKTIREQRDGLRGISDDFDAPHGRAQARAAHGGRGRDPRRAGQEGAGGSQPPPGRLDREEVHEPRPAVPGPDPGGQHRPHEGRRQVRVQARLQVLDLRDVVDPPGHHPRHRRPGPHHPHPGPHDRDDQQAHPHLARAGAGAGPRAVVGRDREAHGHPGLQGPQGPEDRAGADLAGDARSARKRIRISATSSRTATWSRRRRP